MIKKLWVKFDGLDVECFCEENRKKCVKEEEPKCKEYVVKFVEIKRDITTERATEILTREQKAVKNIIEKIKRYDSELKRNIKKFKV